MASAKQDTENHITPAHGFTGIWSYSSMSSQPIPLPASHARASISSLVVCHSLFFGSQDRDRASIYAGFYAGNP